MPGVFSIAVPEQMAPHDPVLADEVVEALRVAPDAVVIDCTFGAGGHARRIGRALGPEGRYIAIDQDPTVEPYFDAFADQVLCDTVFIRQNFADALHELVLDGVRADAILMDLGVSSMQIDVPERGFSYSRQAPLDMRMNPGAPMSAADVVAEASEGELTGWLKTYGEERFAKSIARAIVRRRAIEPITTTGELVDVVRGAMPAGATFAGGHPAKRTFQALRIVVNDELDPLPDALRDAFELLAPGGRMAVISFHSLEDKIVKRFTRDVSTGCICPPDLPVCGCGRTAAAELIGSRAIMPSVAEVHRNARARSARMRVIERLEA
ncbi:MAG: 16S rRNA (cytosine(1402)-N(4))-methyltransferase RsmH [Thermoleophilia bacterium]